MCNICAEFRVASDCPYDGPPQSISDASAKIAATIHEASDAAASTSTTASMSAGDSFHGTMSSNTDVDWIEIELVAGTEYNFAVTSDGDANLTDTRLTIYDATGTQVAFNDDIDYGGGNHFSALDYTATSTGTYYVGVSAYPAFLPSSNAGDYVVSVSGGAPGGPGLPAGTVQELADYLRVGFWADNGSGARGFSGTALTVNLTDLNATEAALARQALETWAMLTPLTFTETSSSGASIIFRNDDAGDSSSLNAYAINSTSGSTITQSEVVVSSGWLASFGNEVGSYGYQTYLHEIGHALGLGHQSDYNGSAAYPANADFANDSWHMSVMSYFSQQENTAVAASHAYVITPMMADILAIQDIYGTPGGGATQGDTIWGAGANLGTALDDVFADIAAGTSTAYTGDDVAFTVYDAGGTDTLDLSYSTGNDRIDLTAGSASDVAGLIGNIAISLGTTIENLTAGSGNDTITGNDAANTILGGNGLDDISGGGGNDYLNGGRERDTVRGGDGDDEIHGYLSHDRLYGDGGDDALYGSNGSDYMKGGTGSDFLHGGRQADSLFGGDGNDQLRGGSEDDTLRGGGGNDVLYGQAGRDTFIFDDDFGRDAIYDFDLALGEIVDLSGVAAITSWSDLQSNHLGQTAGGSAQIIVDTDNIVTISAVAMGDLSASFFVF